MKILSSFHDQLTAPRTFDRIKQVQQVMDFIYFEDERGRVWRVYMGPEFPHVELASDSIPKYDRGDE